MRIDAEKCIGCRRCFSFCSVDAHSVKKDLQGKLYSEIDQDLCCECGVCLRNAPCPTEAIYQPEEAYEFPRMVRALLSDPLIEFKQSGVPGRGTAEIKTNEITGRVKYGTVGVALELGRPGVSTRWTEVEKMTKALAQLDVGFCDENPVTYFMKDKNTGELQDEVVQERSLSAIIEFDCQLEELPNVLKVVRENTHKLNTVFTFDVGCKVRPDGSIPARPMIEEAGYPVLMNSKNNVGLGRPRYREEGETL